VWLKNFDSSRKRRTTSDDRVRMRKKSTIVIIIPLALGLLILLPAAATATTTATSNTTSASEIELSAEPIYQEEQITISETPINETHIQADVSGNGTINLPNSTETINNINNGSYIISTKDGSIFGKEVWSTEDETENVTTTFYAITRFGMEEGTNKAIVIAATHTNSTGKLAPLNGMILAGQVDFRPDGSRLVTLWEWENGIPLSTGNTTATEEPALTNTTSTTAEEEAVGGAEVAE
jgi:guanyl-specific ribonuclease Sa